MRKRCCVFTTYQVLKSPHKRDAEAAVVQLFGITKIYNLVNQLIQRKEEQKKKRNFQSTSIRGQTCRRGNGQSLTQGAYI